MAKPSKERVRKWREKKAAKGGRNLSTWLEPETVRMMDFLLDHYGESAAPLIARAVNTLYRVTCNEQECPSNVTRDEATAGSEANGGISHTAACSSPNALPVAPATTATEAVGESSTGVAELHPLLHEIKTKLSLGVPFKELQKTLLVQWIKSMQAAAVSLREMSELLNAAAIPTPSGKGRWEQGMIPTMLLLSSF